MGGSVFCLPPSLFTAPSLCPLFLLFSPREQELSNLLQQKDYVHAVGLAITLDQPFRVLSILSGRTPLKALLHVFESLLWCLRLPPDLLDEGGEEGRFGETILALREDQTCEPSTPGPGVVHIVIVLSTYYRCVTEVSEQMEHEC